LCATNSEVVWLRRVLQDVGEEQKKATKSLCATSCEVVWLRRVLQDVGEEQKKATKIKCDSQSSIKLENDPVYHARKKHVDSHFHFIRKKIQSK